MGPLRIILVVVGLGLLTVCLCPVIHYSSMNPQQKESMLEIVGEIIELIAEGLDD
jgi:hypothetical protein